MNSLFRRLRLFLQRDRASAELEEEMRLHRDLRAAMLAQQGLSLTDAQHSARRRFGRPDHHLERSREMWGLGSLDDLRQDIRFALRRLRQRPAFTAAVIGVLALGTGATTAMFSAVDAAMLRPLPFPHAEQLVTVPGVSVPSSINGAVRPHSPTGIDINDLGEMRTLFADVAAMASGGMNLSDPTHPQRLTVGVVTRSFFPLIGVTPLRGRTFDADEGRPGGPRAAVLSWKSWQDLYGGREIVGQSIILNDRPYQVVGIMPRGFSFPTASDLWIPMTVPVTAETFEPFHGFLNNQVIARLNPTTTVAHASNQLLAEWSRRIATGATAANREAQHQRMASMKRRGTLLPLQAMLLGNGRAALLVLFGATGLLLLIACANVANLLLSQAVLRRREIAIREVLGARRGRVIRQLLTESVLLSLGGVVVGIALAPLLLGVLADLLPATLTTVAGVQIDLRVLAFAVVTSLITGVAFGLWPAIGNGGVGAGEAIKGSGNRGATSRDTGRIRRLLVASELALTIVLLVGAGLMLRSFIRVTALDRGMNTDLAGTLDIAFASSVTDIGPRVDAILARLAATPGVRSAGTINDLPLGGGGGLLLSVVADGVPPSSNPDQPGAHQLIATDGYFDAMGIPLLAGRTFTPADDSTAPPMAIISATAARTYWPGLNPLGRTFRSGANNPDAITVIGIVPDVREFSLAVDPLPELYLSGYRDRGANMTIVARGTLSPKALIGAIERAVHAVDPTQPVFHRRTMTDVVETSLAPRRTSTVLIALFAGIALCIALLGVYAVVSQSVAQRNREFGIRAALGASRTALVALACRDLAAVLGLGLVGGIAAAWALARVARSLIYGVNSHDPMTFVLVPVLLAATTAAATIIPARRASRVNPADAMRAD